MVYRSALKSRHCSKLRALYIIGKPEYKEYIFQPLRMTILFFARLFYPHIGGVEKHVLEIGKRLVKKGHRVIVITEQLDNISVRIKPTDSIEGISIHRIPVGKNGWFKKFRIWSWLWNNRKLMHTADVVHCHDVFFWYLPFKFLYPRKKVFTTFHGYEGNNLPSRKAILMHKIAEVVSDGNICIGDYLKKWYGTKPTYVSYGAIEIPSPKIIKKKASSNKHAFVFIGRLEEETGMLTYLKTMTLLKNKRIPFSLQVLGDGSQRNICEQYSKKHKLNIEFRGFVPDVYKFIHQADYVLTSRFLGTMEAFVMKKFVFAVYNNEIKKDCFAMAPYRNYLVLVKNETALAKKIIYCLQHKKIVSEKITNAYDWVKKHTWDSLTDLYLRLWLKSSQNSSWISSDNRVSKNVLSYHRSSADN